MKEEYKEAQIEIIRLEGEDVITDSNEYQLADDPVNH